MMKGSERETKTHTDEGGVDCCYLFTKCSKPESNLKNESFTCICTANADTLPCTWANRLASKMKSRFVCASAQYRRAMRISISHL